MFLCQVCPRWRSLTGLGHRTHLRWHLRCRCGLCRRLFAHPHLRLRHRLLGHCRGTRRSRNPPPRAGLVTRRDAELDRNLKEATEDRNSSTSLRREDSDKVPCPKCRKLYKNRHSLESHLVFSQSCGSKGSDRGQRCDKCGRAGTGQWLAEHLYRSISCGWSSVACPECGLTLANANSLATHRRRKDACRLAKRRRPYEALLASAESEAGPRTCPKCSQVFPDSLSFKRHLEKSASCGYWHEGPLQSCHVCGRSGRRAWLLDHLRSSLSCGRRKGVRELRSVKSLSQRSQRALANAALIQRAQRESREEGTSELRCPDCRAAKNTVQALRGHLKISRQCGADKTLRCCDECGMSFLGQADLARHALHPKACQEERRRRRVLRIAGVELGKQNSSRLKPNLRCPNCGKACPNASLLAKHLASAIACEKQIKTRRVEEAMGSRRDFRCPKCGHDAKHRDGLRDHLSFSRSCGEQNGDFTCDKCSEAFSKRGRLVDHYKRNACEAKMTDSYRLSLKLSGANCPKCGKYFEIRESLLSHVRESRSCGYVQDRFRCDECPLSFPQMKILTDHVKGPLTVCQRKKISLQRITERLYACPECAYSTKVLHNFQKHRKSKKSCHITRLREEQARLSVFSQQQEPDDASKPEYLCPNCGYKTANIYNFRKHMCNPKSCEYWLKRHRKAGEESPSEQSAASQAAKEAARKFAQIFTAPPVPLFKCPNCNYTAQKGTVQIHLRSSRACDLYKLKQENEQLIKKLEMKSEDSEAPTSGEGSAEGGRSYPCPNCGNAFKTPKALKDHLRWEANERTCDRCGMTLHGSNLMKHIQSTIACDLELRRREALDKAGIVVKRKSLQQTGPLELVCSKCSATFAHIYKLKDHLSRSGCEVNLRRRWFQERVGGEEGRKACGKCGSPFASRLALSNHLRFSRGCGETPFFCDACGQRVSSASNLVKHVRVGTSCEQRQRKNRKDVAAKAVVGEGSSASKGAQNSDTISRRDHHMDHEETRVKSEERRESFVCDECIVCRYLAGLGKHCSKCK